MTFRFFVDDADPAVWREARRQGWLYGATTNPQLLERAGRACDLATAQTLVDAAADIGLAELQLQAWGARTAALTDTGAALAELSPRVTVKVPATREGLAAAAELHERDIRVTLTACYTAHQCALADALGLEYVAPYYGRMLEAGLDADARLDAMAVVAARGGRLRILVASLRTTAQLDALLGRGFDTFTVAAPLATTLGVDPGSEAAAAAFEAAARSRDTGAPT